MLTLTPVVCVCGGIVVSEILAIYLDLKRPVLAGGEDPLKAGDVTSSRKRRKSTPPEDEPEPEPIGLRHRRNN
jgi:hypothetical protein